MLRFCTRGALFAALAVPQVAGLPVAFNATWSANGRIYSLKGFKPDGPETHPAFMSFGGSGDGFPNDVWQTFAYQMAFRGFVAADIQYNNNLSLVSPDLCREFGPKADAVYQGPSSALAVLCAMTEADCAKGVATAGHSQGGYIALHGPRKDARVTAVMAMAVAGEDCASSDSLLSAHLPRSKRRFINAYDDWLVGQSGTTTQLDQVKSNNLAEAKEVSGYDCGSELDCLQADGSGYYLVSHDDYKQAKCVDGSVSHSFFFSDGTDDSTIQSDTSFLCDFLSPGRWGLTEDLDWLAQSAQTASDELPAPRPSLTYNGKSISCRSECPPEDPGKGIVDVAVTCGLGVAVFCCCLASAAVVCRCVRDTRKESAQQWDDESPTEESFSDGW